MLIVTTNDLPGYEVEEILGEVFGLTVRSRNVGSQIGASLKSLAGGELKGNFHRLCPDGTPQANLLLTMLHKLGVDLDSIGDSTGEVAI